MTRTVLLGRGLVKGKSCPSGRGTLRATVEDRELRQRARRCVDKNESKAFNSAGQAMDYSLAVEVSLSAHSLQSQSGTTTSTGRAPTGMVVTSAERSVRRMARLAVAPSATTRKRSSGLGVTTSRCLYVLRATSHSYRLDPLSASAALRSRSAASGEEAFAAASFSFLT